MLQNNERKVNITLTYIICQNISNLNRVTPVKCSVIITFCITFLNYIETKTHFKGPSKVSIYKELT